MKSVLLRSAVAALLLVSLAGCTSKSLEIGGTVYQSLDIDRPFVRIVLRGAPPRPPSDLGPLTFAEVRVAAPDKSDRIVRTSTDKDGRFSVTFPGGLFRSHGKMRIVFRQEGYKAVNFMLEAEELRRAMLDDAGNKHYLEFWVPFLEPD